MVAGRGEAEKQQPFRVVSGRGKAEKQQSYRVVAGRGEAEKQQPYRVVAGRGEAEKQQPYRVVAGMGAGRGEVARPGRVGQRPGLPFIRHQPVTPHNTGPHTHPLPLQVLLTDRPGVLLGAPTEVLRGAPIAPPDLGSATHVAKP